MIHGSSRLSEPEFNVMRKCGKNPDWWWITATCDRYSTQHRVGRWITRDDGIFIRPVEKKIIGEHDGIKTFIV